LETPRGCPTPPRRKGQQGGNRNSPGERCEPRGRLRGHHRGHPRFRRNVTACNRSGTQRARHRHRSWRALAPLVRPQPTPAAQLSTVPTTTSPRLDRRRRRRRTMVPMTTVPTTTTIPARRPSCDAHQDRDHHRSSVRCSWGFSQHLCSPTDDQCTHVCGHRLWLLISVD
jgi:hypothetical protein